MKLLALDIDGVLNSGRWYYERENSFRDETMANELDPKAIVRLNLICSLSECRIVISSSWRILEKSCEASIPDMLANRGFLYPERIIGRTPVIYDPLPEMTRRGVEIHTWIDEQPEHPASLCILDDSADMGHLLPHLVRTTWPEGLLDKHIQQALEMLERPFAAVWP